MPTSPEEINSIVQDETSNKLTPTIHNFFRKENTRVLQVYYNSHRLHKLDFQELNLHIQKIQLKDLDDIKITPEASKT